MSRRRWIWDGNPETEPEFHVTELERKLDVDGVELVLVVDQDGEEYCMDADVFDDTAPREPEGAEDDRH